MTLLNEPTASAPEPVDREPTVDLTSPEAFAAAYDRHRARVFAIALRIVRRRELAEDITQDVFAWLWAHPERYDARRPLGAYLTVIAHSRATDAWRRGAAERRASERLSSEPGARGHRVDTDPAVLVERAHTRAQIRAAVTGVPVVQREALVLSYWGELSRREVAMRTGAPLGTVKTRVRLAMERLARTLPPPQGACPVKPAGA